MFKKLVIIASMLSVSGCAINLGGMKDVDLEKEEQKRLKNNLELYKPTPPHVRAADVDGIVIHADKRDSIKDDQLVEQEVWSITAQNTNTEGKCISMRWKLLDFEYISNEPTAFYLKARETREIGTMMQTIWNLDGVRFAPPASGFIEMFKVNTPLADAEVGKECVNIVEDGTTDAKETYKDYDDAK